MNPGAQSNAELAAIESAYQALSAATTTAGLVESSFSDFRGLFGAIARLSEKHTDVHHLANIGVYLAGVWGSLHDGERETLSRMFSHFASLRNEIATANQPGTSGKATSSQEVTQ